MTETAASLFVFGTWVFWLSIVFFVGLLFACIEWERGFWATICLIGYVFLLQFGFQVDLFQYAVDHPLRIIGAFAGYFALGTGWSIFRWYLYVKDRLEQFIEYKLDWLAKEGRPNLRKVPDDLKEKWKNHLESDWLGKQVSQVPSVRQNKSRVLRWIGYWPISAIWWLVADFVRKIATNIYSHIANFLQSIADRIFADEDLN